MAELAGRPDAAAALRVGVRAHLDRARRLAGERTWLGRAVLLRRSHRRCGPIRAASRIPRLCERGAAPDCAGGSGLALVALPPGLDHELHRYLLDAEPTRRRFSAVHPGGLANSPHAPSGICWVCLDHLA